MAEARQAQSERRMREIKKSKTIRAPLPTQGRSFRPQYGDAMKVKTVDSLYAETTTGRKVLTKEAQPIPADSLRRPAGQLTDPAYVKRQRLQTEANKLQEHLLQQLGESMRLTDLERNLRTELPAVARGLQKANTRFRPFLRMYPQIFKVDRGVVVALNAPRPREPDEPASGIAGRPKEPPESREERNERLDRLLAESRAREEASQAARAERQ